MRLFFAYLGYFWAIKKILIQFFTHIRAPYRGIASGSSHFTKCPTILVRIIIITFFLFKFKWTTRGRVCDTNNKFLNSTEENGILVNLHGGSRIYPRRKTEASRAYTEVHGKFYVRIRRPHKLARRSTEIITEENGSLTNLDGSPW